MDSQPSPAHPSPYPGKLVRPRFLYRQWMLAGNPSLFFDRLVQDFGDFIHYRGLFSFYLVNHPSLVKHVLQETNKSFDKSSVIYDRFRNAFGDGLVVAEGERWWRQRRLIQPMCGPNAIKQFFDLMVDSANHLADRWEPTCRSGQVFDLAAEGSVVVFSRYSLHRHKGFWKAPERFDPERFGTDKEENKRSVYAHIPFGGGPRICIGLHFAMMELVIVLAVIARRYKIILDASHRHDMAAHLTMTPKYGVKVRLEAR